MTDEFTTPDASPRDYVPRGDAEARAKVPRDQWDRYLMPHLDGTKPARNKGFTRVSTIKSGLSNQTGIKVWTGEKIVEGLGQDTELVEASMRAAKLVDPEDRKRALRKIADRAFVVGGGKDRSGKGTEFHEVTERINRAATPGAEEDNELATMNVSHLQPELDAYYQMLSEHDVQILPDMLERQVLCPYNMAGTFDNMVRWWNPDTEEWELCIADLKTGRDLSLGWLEILMQIWSYANAYGMWTTTDVTTAADGTITDVQGYYEPMPLELRKDKALIFHVPLDGTATLYVLDLSGVERYVAAAVEAKRANAEAKHKVRKVATVTPAAFVAPIVSGTTATTETFHRPEPDGPWAPVRPAEDKATSTGFDRPHAFKTPDQIEQERKRDERLAKVAAMANPNTDGDDEPERDPVTGRKKRTCGHCRKPGHTQKNCPENPASAKFQGDVGRTVTGTDRDISLDEHMAGLAASHPGGVFPDDSPLATPALGTEPITDAERDQQAYDYAATTISPAFAAALAPNHQAFPNALAEADAIRAERWSAGAAPSPEELRQDSLTVAAPDQPWCHLAHAHEWTSAHPAAPGRWVCATTGKPSREAYEAGGDPTTPPAEVIDPASVGTIAPPVWADSTAGPHTADFTMVVLGRIASASSQAELLRLRADAIEAGHWVESLHNGPAMARYQALA